MHRILIVADDLSGAADCGIVCAAHGLETVVVLNESGGAPGADVLVIDADTRGLAPAMAAAKTAGIVRTHMAVPGQALFKKLDSAMRGNIGAELAAALRVRRQAGHRSVVVMAPAFPAVGRTTSGGLQYAGGVPVADVPAMLSAAGLRTVPIGLAEVRAGTERLLALIGAHSDECDAVVCDAATDEDLLAIARAAAGLRNEPVWAGSAGLARHLPHALGFTRSAISCFIPPVQGSILTVVGSRAGISLEQAAVQGAAPDLQTQTFPSEMDELEAALARGRDVMVLLAGDHCRELGRFLAPLARQIGGMILTGGETARAVLGAFGVTGLRLVDELEPGVPLSLTEGFGPLPVITKAGSFGDRDTLVRCRTTLRKGLKK